MYIIENSTIIVLKNYRIGEYNMYKEFHKESSLLSDGQSYFTPDLLEKSEIVELPEPLKSGGQELWSLLNKRESVRKFKADNLELTDLSQLLWATQGQKSARKKTVPSAGACHPFETYVVTGGVKNLDSGIQKERSFLVS